MFLSLRQRNFNDAMLILENMNVVHKISSIIRVYGEEA